MRSMNLAGLLCSSDSEVLLCLCVSMVDFYGHRLPLTPPSALTAGIQSLPSRNEENHEI